ncbi:MAG: phospholipid carrier-dependent glycosyltransferase, partial [Cyanobacteria bacterium P01_H01_bin.58]
VLWFRAKRRSRWFVGLLVANWLALSVAGTSGLLGNANPELKAFLQQREVQSIVANNVIYFTPLRSKLGVLMRFYTPNPGPRVEGIEVVPNTRYAWVWEDAVGDIQVPHRVIDQFEQVYLIQVGN